MGIEQLGHDRNCSTDMCRRSDLSVHSELGRGQIRSTGISEVNMVDAFNLGLSSVSNMTGKLTPYSGAQPTQQSSDQAQMASQMSPSGMGGISFGQGAFPNATQAAFGGMGGLGIGTGGQATGGTISLLSNGQMAYTPATSAAAPSGMSSTTIILAAIALVVVLAVIVIGMGDEGEIEEALGMRHKRRHRR